MSGAPNDSYLGGLFYTASAGNIARRMLPQRRVAVARPQRKPRAARPHRISKRDQVAEFLSLDMGFVQIAERMGITLKAVRRHFESIRKALGAQAV